MRYEIKGDSLPVLLCYLEAGETVTCQKGAMSGHNVSHSNRKTNRVWLPNTQRVRVNVGGTVRHMNVCTRCLRSGKVERAL